ncbi:DNA polymerase III subunit gamma and tau [Cellulomonas sp. S1-8]|uniref:DNA polymerase III subunit gamma and tau n=1 Tax=Cellulomonas sp. S1-8 TaxID=2904790 RepID=UPI00224335FA|nr:DNA polymerase III subunit gamma and tau [Cellulomonas sp. S1-8]UZN02858.1 DNA polymerase III subunit gamma and tau [Cellulomonas sp. S1-8]
MTTALYRRYRPESFAEVIGQDHVTAPLRQALRSGQSNHAYLFSGPRGCGKTTSARILARCLNCAEGPTDTPCGVCPSCLELARGGSGSLDVVEIDAASHGGVDDARELRERATFAPARDRYKVFILDEAHMVSPQGFNALLKIVEEPPPHVKFIFATTEPDKVIGTIRSRTHHYPFRLVPPDVLVPYLEQLCATEGVTVGAGVLSLVVRAGSGSVRDTLSVLDQLIAGSGPAGLDYEGAVALLGYTHTSLLDDLVDAIAARDGASAFRVVERVIATGHEPRRFVEDLLERLRDLIIIAASGEAAGAVLRDVPADQLDRMRRQATHLGMSEVSRSADLANAALTEMVGATSPRLHLELLMARLLLPSVDDSRSGHGARLDRLERGLPVGGAAAEVPGVPGGMVSGRPAGTPPETSVPAAGSASPGAAAEPPEREAASAGVGGHDAPVPDAAAPVDAPMVNAPQGGPTGGTAERPTPPPGATAPRATEPRATEPRATEPRATEPRASEPVPAEQAASSPFEDRPEAAPTAASHPAAEAPPTAEAPPASVAPSAPERPAAAAPPAPGAVAAAADTEMLRRRWPDVLTTLRRLRLPSWALVNQHAQILELDATTLRLGFAQPGLVTTFRNSNHGEVVARALSETLGVTARVEAVLDEPGGTSAQAASASDVPDQPGAMSPERAAASWGEPVRTAPRTAPPPAVDAPARRGGDRPAGPTHAGAGSTTPRPAADPSGTGGHAPGEAATTDGSASGAGPRTVPPWESGPGDEPGGARNGPAGGRPDAPTDADRGGPPVVVHPDDDIPPGDEPDDPWRNGAPPARRPSAGPSGAPTAAHRTGSAAPPAAGDGRTDAPAGATGPTRATDTTGATGARPAPGEADAASAAGPARGTARERGVAAARAAAQSRGRNLEPDEPSPDDPPIGQSGLVGAPLVAQVLGGRVIDEQIDGI